MTNEEIILQRRCELVELGELATTDRMIMFKGQQVPEPEEIHTYDGWKKLGYQVKRGEHAVAKFQIWKFAPYKAAKKQDEPEEEQEQRAQKGRCVKKLAFFFKFDQVEKLS